MVARLRPAATVRTGGHVGRHVLILAPAGCLAAAKIGVAPGAVWCLYCWYCSPGRRSGPRCRAGGVRLPGLVAMAGAVGPGVTAGHRAAAGG
ncbi:hypothetical protein Drose_28535 [Dactylosporangium roseum]|uniref:Uncharacterized protein n=1 Tax=Dactylosporangium roseum TaxID=47989 RepID=A0ABY5YZA0_9ACTN|nr:hypothetical protein [Dactylosporangium roseum]UWZ35080.1 hypothetical protein Drose_28535 [Dactylosporangium roseum]